MYFKNDATQASFSGKVKNYLKDYTKNILLASIK